MKSRRAEISVFFAAIIMLTAALLLGIAESARIQSARLYMTVAMNSAVDSLFSQYHRELWDKYRILGLEHYKDRQLTDEMAEFIGPYFEADDMYPMSLKDIKIIEKELITDNGGAVFEQEILDYMKYGILLNSPDEESISEYIRYTEEALNTDGITDSYYRKHIKEAMKIEDIVEEIRFLIEEQKQFHTELIQEAEAFSLGGVTSVCNNLKSCLKRLSDKIKTYNEITIDFYERLIESENDIGLDYANDKIGKFVYEELINEINTYKDYFSEDSKRSGELNAIKEATGQNIDYLDLLIEQAELAEMEINDYVAEEEGDGPDIEAIWQPVIDECRNYRILDFNSGFGVEDREKRKRIEAVMNLKNSRLMKMLLPEGMNISKAKINKTGLPSMEFDNSNKSLRTNMLDRFYISSYIRSFVNYYGKIESENMLRKADEFFGVEYILNGKDTNYENLSDVIYELTAIRTGLNLIFLYGNAERQAEAYALASQITGITGFTPVTGIVKNMIVTAWAFAQGLCDVRDLLHGKRVPVMHSDNDFYLSTEQLPEIPVSEKLPEYNGEHKGQEYSEYLGLLILMKWGSKECFRTMDMLQFDISEDQKDFRMNRCARGIKAEFDLTAGMLFTRLGLMRDISDGGLKREYSVKLTAEDSY